MGKIPSLKIGKLEARIPIIQGGMSVGISLSTLAAAVANEGGIGVIGTAGIGMLEPDFNTNYLITNRRALTKEIKQAKKNTNGIIGVNILVALSDCDELVQVAIDEGVDLIFVGAGLPLKIPKTLPQDKLKKFFSMVVPIISSQRATKIIFQYWAKEYNDVPNAVVVEGPLAGGHLGFSKEHLDNPDYALDKILPEVIAEVKLFEKQFNKNISVIAAGGIYTGADIHKFMNLGANGVQMATRFVATNECDASIKFKDSYVKCKKEDLIIIDSPVGMPGRAIKNQFLEDVANGIGKPFKCPWKCLKTCEFRKAPYCIGLSLTNAKKGNIEEGFCFAGANAYRIDKIVSVKELVKTLLEEYEEASSK
ncbi:MAG: nitronate monooxygenase [Elusimicrobiota bacterium]